MQRPELTLIQVTSPSSQTSSLTQTTHLLRPLFFGDTHSHRCSLPSTAWNSSFYLPPTLPYSSQLLFLRKRNKELGSSTGRGQRRGKTLTQYSRCPKFQEPQRGAVCVLASIAKRSASLMEWQSYRMISMEIITCNVKLLYFKFVCVYMLVCGCM